MAGRALEIGGEIAKRGPELIARRGRARAARAAVLGALWCAVGAATAGPAVPEGGDVWDMPETSGHSVRLSDVPPAPAPAPMRGDAIAAAAFACYPEPVGGWFRPEVRAVVGPRMSADDDGGSSGYWAGLTLSLPLYSHSEIAREREQSYRRQRDVAEAVGAYLVARATVTRGEREAALWDAVETRARSRVAMGVAPSSEQESAAVRAIEARATVEGARAALEAARLALLVPCDSAGAARLEAALREGWR